MPPQKPRTLTERINTAVGSAKISNGELARRTGLSKQAIGKIMSGATKHVRPTSIERIAAATGFRAEWLLTGTGPPHYIPEAPPPDPATEKRRALIKAAEELPEIYVETAARLIQALPRPLYEPPPPSDDDVTKQAA